MKLYVASSWRNVRHPLIVELMRQEGNEVYDFMETNSAFNWDDIKKDVRTWGIQTFKDAIMYATTVAAALKNDKDGLDWAEGLILVNPCGRSAHLELGYAIGQGKPTAILLDSGDPDLMYGMATNLCVDTVDLMHVVRRWNQGGMAE